MLSTLVRFSKYTKIENNTVRSKTNKMIYFLTSLETRVYILVYYCLSLNKIYIESGDNPQFFRTDKDITGYVQNSNVVSDKL